MDDARAALRDLTDAAALIEQAGLADDPEVTEAIEQAERELAAIDAKKDVPDPDWAHGLAHGYRPYHVHFSFEDFGVPQDEASIEKVAAGGVAKVEADGFQVWPNATRVDYDGERIIVEVLVRYGSPGSLSGWFNRTPGTPDSTG